MLLYESGLHMALGYDYDECADFLVSCGADLLIKNAEGHAAKNGLEGDKGPDGYVAPLAELREARTPEESVAALNRIAKEGLGAADKAALPSRTLWSVQHHYRPAPGAPAGVGQPWSDNLDSLAFEIDEEAATCRTKADAPEIDGNLFIDEGFETLSAGDLVTVEVDEASEYDLWGKRLN